MQRRTLGVAVLSVSLMSACAPQPHRSSDGTLEREALAGTEKPAPVVMPTPSTLADSGTNAPSSSIRGNGKFVQPKGLARPLPTATGQGSITLNFENQPVEAVIKAILGDLLDVNYSIAPGVAGSVSFSTSKPVRKDEVLPILESLLAWTGNALTEDHGRYAVMPSTYAVAGRVVPRLKAASPRAGMSARLYPLQYVAAAEMTKLLQPFVTSDAILLTDPARNVLVLAGTPDQLANYGETIDTFDVDWVKGMSVGVFSLDNANVAEVMPALDAVFGQKSGAPVAGLVRFIAIERTNAIVAIAARAGFLDQVGEWIERIDHGGGSEPRLFVYDVRNLLASDLARYVGNIFGASVATDSPSSATLSPGLSPVSLDAGESTPQDGISSQEDSDPDFFQAPQNTSASSTSHSGSKGAGVRVTAVDTNNQLMVYARPSQWTQIRQAVERLDSVPLQVQIETRILEVTLRDNFRFGVQWYLEGLAGGAGGVSQPGNKQQWALGRASIDKLRPDTFFYSFVNSELDVALRAMEQNTNTKILSAPSLVVVNNRKAKIQVGDQIPVTQTYVNTSVGSGNTVGQVEYKDTGVILEVRPRVNPGGLVYLDVVQEVSRAAPDGTGQNLPIVKRKLNTQVAVQSGQTVLLGGLIRDMDSSQRASVPGLSRIPLLGHLFGERSTEGQRTELLVLITPKVISSGEDAKRVSDDYRRSFRSLRPFEAGKVGEETSVSTNG